MSSITVPHLDLHGCQISFSVPSSKSIANRALILSALTAGSFFLMGDFLAEDIQLMIKALRLLGIRIEQCGNGLKIDNDLSWRDNTDYLRLFLGNSGTCLRFLSSLMALRSGNTLLTGNGRMKERPIADLVTSLGQLNIHVRYIDREGFPPIEITGHESVAGGKISMAGDTSSQFVSSLLLVASAFDKGLSIEMIGELISRPYVRMTLALISAWGGVVEDPLRVLPTVFLAPKGYAVEGDASAATYWWALAFIHDCNIRVDNVPLDSIQGDVRFLSVLSYLRQNTPCTEMGFEIYMNDMPDASLTLMIIAPFLAFPMKITGLASLRVKETDRIEAMVTELRKCGISIESGEDWVKIHPMDADKYPSDLIQINTYEDHRIAMSMAILGTKLGNLEILDPDCVKKSYPGFWKHLNALIAFSK